MISTRNIGRISRAAIAFAATATFVAAAVGPAAAAPDPDTSAKAPKAQETPRATDKDTRYCVVDRITGSILEHKVCKTRDQWLAQGFDPLDPKK
ncbi:MAG: hypothetical protein J7500_06480 [Sphingomonas sp.]|uniref:hypothetical protein n=1 Tax=Sphingomonas sp. TaxID=28214 RepID=UPI001B137442|nr:hypothetical protein [Sphingomonas sp.]MBO9622342.1 hypothetical protein [Sphingomonas sp.]